MNIEHNIPLPKRGTGYGPTAGASKYGFHKLADGDSILCRAKSQKQKYRVRVSASQFGIRNKLVMATRVEGDGIRVWRIGKKVIDAATESP